MRGLPIYVAILLGLMVCASAWPQPPLPTDRAASVAGSIVYATNRPADPPPDEAPAAIVDPFPIRRVYLTPDQLSQRLPWVQRGGWTRRPLEEFERRVRAASEATQPHTPELLEARYQARYANGQLRGNAEWVVRSPSARPTLMPVNGLRLAVSDGQWADHEAAILVNTDPAGGSAEPKLRVAHRGDQIVTLQWSARVTEEPGVDRFDLGVPSAPLALFTLDLPADHVPTVSSSRQLLSGPKPGPDPSRRLWTILFSGQSRIELAVRRFLGPSQPRPLTLVKSQTSRFVVDVGTAKCEYEFDLEPIRDSASWSFQVDPGLQILNVTSNGRVRWETPASTPSATPTPTDQPSTFVVTSLDPVPPTRIRIQGIAAPSQRGGWTMPAVRLLDAVAGRNEISVNVSPDVEFHGLETGDYRVDPTSTVMESGRGYRINLVGMPLLAEDPNSLRHMPTVRFQPANPLYSSHRATLVWHIDRGAPRLSATFPLEVVRGPLVEIPLVIPDGYKLDTAVLTTKEIVDGKSVDQDDSGFAWSRETNSRILLEPSRPLTTGKKAELKLEFSSDKSLSSAGSESASRPIPFPKLNLLNATEHDGTLRIEVASSYRAWTTPVVSADSANGPWSFSYRGPSPEGFLHLTTDSKPAEVSRETVINIQSVEIVSRTRMSWVTEPGRAKVFALFTPQPHHEKWSVTSDTATVRPLSAAEALRWTGLPTIGTTWTLLPELALFDTLRGSWWLVEAARHVDHQTIDVTATARRSGSVLTSGPFETAIPSVVGLVHPPAQVVVAPSLAGRFSVVPGSAVGFPTLARIQPEASSPVSLLGAEKIRDAQLRNIVRFNGRIRCRWSCRITSGSGTVFALRLPAQAEQLTLTFGGKYQPSVREEIGYEGDTQTILLPIPAMGAEGIVLAATYELPESDEFRNSFIRHTLLSPLPDVDGEEEVTSVKWDLPPELLPWSALVSHTTQDPRQCIVASRAGLTGLGYALAAVLLGLLLTIRRWFLTSRKRCGLLLLLPVAIGLAIQIIPEGGELLLRPALIVTLFGMAYLVLTIGKPRRGALIRPVSIGPRRSSPAVVARLGLLAVLFSSSTVAQAPAPLTVYLIPSEGNDPKSLAVYVPVEGWKRLEELVRPALPPVLITKAEYDGAATDGSLCSFTATYQLLVTGDDPQTFALPLSGVRLERLELDGRDAFPEATAPDRFTVTLSGAGHHELIAQFGVMSMTGGVDHEVRFTIPDVPVTQVRFLPPRDSTQVDVPTRRGLQTVAPGPRNKVTADHGSGRVVAIRWSSDTAPGTAVATVRETCVWDLTETNNRLTAAFLYRIERGSLSHLAIEIPAELVPLTPTIRNTENAMLVESVPLRNWRITDPIDGRRTVELVLNSPAQGQLLVVLDLLSKHPTTQRPLLRFPRALQARSTESYYGLRTNGLTLESLEARSGVIDLSPEKMDEFNSIPELQLLARPVDRALQRAVSHSPEIRPVLRPTVQEPTVLSDVVWTIGPQASAVGLLQVSRPISAAPLVVVEFTLPPSIHLDDVRTAELFAWNRQGSRVQIWLKKPTQSVSIQWAGTLTTYLGAGAKATPPVTTLKLPIAQVPGSGSVSGNFRVRALSGWTIAAIVPENPRPAPPLPATAPTEVHTRIDSAATPLPKIEVMRAPQAVAGRLLETVSRRDSRLNYRAVVTIPLPSRQPAHFTVLLNGVPADSQVRLQTSPGCVHRPISSGSGVRTWEVFLGKEAETDVRLELATELGLPVTLPECSIVFCGPPVVWTHRVLVFEHPEQLVKAPPFGWQPANGADLAGYRKLWPKHFSTETHREIWWTHSAMPERWTVTAGVEPVLPISMPTAAPVRVSATTSPAPSPPPTVPPILIINSRTMPFILWVGGVMILAIGLIRLGSGWWPELWILCGALSAWIVGTGSTPALAFWGLVGVGLLCRISGLANRLLRSMLW